jgi:hypothetical protein
LNGRSGSACGGQSRGKVCQERGEWSERVSESHGKRKKWRRDRKSKEKRRKTSLQTTTTYVIASKPVSRLEGMVISLLSPSVFSVLWSLSKSCVLEYYMITWLICKKRNSHSQLFL